MKNFPRTNYPKTGNQYYLITPERFLHAAVLLEVQEKEAAWWEDVHLAYFHSISQRPYPDRSEAPRHDLEYYKAILALRGKGEPITERIVVHDPLGLQVST